MRRPFPVFLILTQLHAIGIVGKEVRIDLRRRFIGFYPGAKAPVPRRRYIKTEPGRYKGRRVFGVAFVELFADIHIPVGHVDNVRVRFRPVAAGDGQVFRQGRGPGRGAGAGRGGVGRRGRVGRRVGRRPGMGRAGGGRRNRRQLAQRPGLDGIAPGAGASQTPRANLEGVIVVRYTGLASIRIYI